MQSAYLRTGLSVRMAPVDITAFASLSGGRWWFILTLFISVGAYSSSTEQAETPPDTYVYWQGQASEARKPFEAALMQLIFALSQDKYGEAKLEISQWKVSFKRAIQLMGEGQRLHIQIVPALSQELDNDAVIMLPYPVLSNLLGYRQLIVRQDDVKRFSSIKNFSEFLTKTAGQGKGWADINVYRHNNINVQEASDFMGMFPMLKHKRFDYIPLGISEARKTLQLAELQPYNFRIVDGLLIYYPWPMTILVAKSHSELAERIHYGFEKAHSTGQYEALFKFHFKDILQTLHQKNVKVIQLETPQLPDHFEAHPTLIKNGIVLK